ncbi:MAG TPA: hypothetical protein VIL44_08915 [Micromonospora sp.]
MTTARPWRWRRWLSIGIASVLLVCGLPAGLAALLSDRSPVASNAAATAPARPAPSPRPGDPLTVTQSWLRDRIAERVEEQAVALLRGDEQGFLALAVPGSPAVATLRRQFRSLRAMGVSVWRPHVDALPERVEGADGVEWRVTVDYDHCFGTVDCAPSSVRIASRWVDGPAGLRVRDVEPSGANQQGPRPWEVSDLVAVAGERTVVATTRAHRSLLPRLLREAERAAAVADRYVVGERRPDQYRVYYAAGPEWRRWYGGDRPEWTAGYAVAVGGGQYDVVLNAERVTPARAGDLLRHELTHVASLPAGGYPEGAAWWLVEGIAELAGAGGRPVRRYGSLAEVRRLLAADTWDGQLATLEPPADATSWEVTARYGVGYLAVRHLVDRFGERRLLAFFAAVVHDRRSLEEAAGEVFGDEWAVLHDECVAYVRSVAGVSA